MAETVAPLTINQVNSDDTIATVVSLAKQIWHQHYPGIITTAQIDYMLDKIQSPAAIRDQLEQGNHYYLIRQLETAIGYFSIREQQDDDDSILFLSKIYLDEAYRGEGLGYHAFSFIEALAADVGAKRINLLVNRNNSIAVNSYLRWGFCITETRITDIGDGYIMDDYLMTKALA